MILKDKKALITGGSQGIGKAAALKLASEGADIAIIHMGSEEDAKAVCEEIKAMGRQAIAYRADVADFAGSKGIRQSGYSCQLRRHYKRRPYCYDERRKF